MDFYRTYSQTSPKGYLFRTILWVVEECLKATHRLLATALADPQQQQVELIILTMWNRVADLLSPLLNMKSALLFPQPFFAEV